MAEKCSCECCCGEEENKLYFCPKCKGTKVGMVQGWRNAFGIFPRWRCKSCGFENMIFPILVKDKLKKKRK